MEDKKNNRKVMISTIVAVLILLVLIVGAAYAYFGTAIVNEATTSTVNTSAKSVGNVTLVDGESLLLNLTADNMAKQTSDVTYWGTNTGTPSTTKNEVTIATASVVGNGVMNCNYKMTITKTADNDLFTAFRNWNDTGKQNGQIALTINTGEATNNLLVYDFNDTNVNFPITYTGVLTGLADGTPRGIKASFYLVNLKDVDQAALAGKDINFNFTFSDFSCEMVGE